MNKVHVLISLSLFFLLILTSCKKSSDEDTGNPDEKNLGTGKTSAIFNQDLTYGSVTDIEGNTYKTIKIGDMVWMAENLRTTKYKDGTPIPMPDKSASWLNHKSGAYCIYDYFTHKDTIATYGCLYNWFAVQSGKLAPEGWHVATDAEWTALINYCGGQYTAGQALKEAGARHWNTLAATYGTNLYGLTILPGGNRPAGTEGFGGMGREAEFWTSSAFGDPSDIYASAWYYTFLQGTNDVARHFSIKTSGYSVRCVKD